MNKAEAIRLLGGTNGSAARAIGITPAAVSQWPEELLPAVTDRVIAALARQRVPPELLGLEPSGYGDVARPIQHCPSTSTGQEH